MAYKSATVWTEFLNEKKDKSNANTSCSLLWQDPMLSIMDPHIWHPELRKHYEKVAGFMKIITW